MKHFDKIFRLNPKLYGVEDKQFNDLDFMRTNNDYLNTKTTYVKTEELFMRSAPGFGRKNFFEFPNKGSNYVYKNLRANQNDYHKIINSIELEISGTRYDKIYGNIIPTLCKIHNLDSDMIPFYLNNKNNFVPRMPYSEYRLIVHFNDKIPEIENYNFDELTFLVDIYVASYNPSLIHAATFMQFTGTEYSGCCDSYKIRLHFNHIVTHLLIKPKKCSIQKLNLNLIIADSDNYVLDYDINECEQYDDGYIIPFVKSE